MPKTALLHIGTRKTGTTSIQRVLSGAREDMAPVRYPLMGLDLDQNRLVTLYLSHDQLPVQWRYVRPATCRRYRRLITKELSSEADAIISGEDLSSWFTPAAAHRLRADLAGLGFQRFHVILYVRDPADYYLSYMQQIVKGSTNSAPVGFHPASFISGLRRVAQTWEGAFPGSLVVRKYPSESEPDIAADFSTQVEKYLGVVLPRNAPRMNETISAEAMKIIQDYRLSFWPDTGGLLTPDAARLVSFLQTTTTDVSQTKPALKREIAACIRANNKPDADFIHSRYGVDLGLTATQPTRLPADQGYRVDDLLESVDSDIVHELLLRVAKSVLERAPANRSLARRIASRTYRAIWQ